MLETIIQLQYTCFIFVAFSIISMYISKEADNVPDYWAAVEGLSFAGGLFFGFIFTLIRIWL